MQELFGLMNTQLHPITLLGVKVDGYLLGRGAKINIRQRFCNQERNTVEAVYKFPLPENSAVTGFKVWIGENHIQSIVEEREKAFEMYDKSLEKGHGAYLLDEERPNIFTLSVGNLNPGMDVIIEINLVMMLDTEGSKYRFSLPTTISPRYVPDNIPDDDGIPVIDIIHPDYAESVPYGLSLMLQINNNGKLAMVESPTHPIRVHLNKDHVQVEFSSDIVKMDRDFILLIDPGETNVGRAYRYDDDKYSYWQLDLALPPGKFTKENLANEFIFLLDCSGSMQGQSIQEAKKALEICLKALPQNCTFNVYRFGSTFNSFFKLSSPYSDKNLNESLHQLQRTDADLGGTEIYAPLKEILELPLTSHYRIIIMLTDGEIGNEQQIFKLMSDNNKNLRIFSIGIGTGPNEHLIKGLARLGNGAFEFIYPGEHIEPKVLRIFSKVNIPQLNIKNISWNGNEVEQAPVNPIIFADTVTTIYARSKSLAPKISQLPVQVNIGTEIIKCDFKIVKVSPDSIPIPTLWARERIRDLEYDNLLSGSQQLERKDHKIKEMIISISKDYGILSRYTSFVGIEDREEKDKSTGEVKLRKVPTLITTGWHGRGQILHRRAFSLDTEYLFIDVGDIRTVPCFKSKYKILYSKTHRTSPKKKTIKSEILTDLLLTQHIDGGFYINDSLARRLNLNLKNLKIIANRIEVKIPVDTLILLSTVIIIEVLRTLFNELKNIWQGLAYKSITWLDEIMKYNKPLIDGQELTEWAKEFVKKEVKLKNY